MGAADTAKLIASLGLKDQFSGPLKNADNALGKFDAHLTKSGSRGLKAGQQIGTGIKNAAKIAVAGIGTLTGLLLLSAKEGQDAANVQKIYATAIANSGKVSQAQVAILNAQQTALMNLSGADDELIKSEQTRLITMGLTGDAVAKLTPLIQDAATATGKDLLTVTTAVGKAALGNTTALAKLGIIIPKAAKATKSAALASLEHAKAQLLVTENLDKSHGALTKNEKAHYAEKKAALDAAIGQQKLTDAQKGGTKATSDLDAVTNALNQRFGGTTKALSGSLNVKLEVLNQALANVRESAGQKLLPALTRIVDVVAQRLVPAFGQFIDQILPPAIAGLDKLASFLEGGGATSAINSFLTTAKAVMPVIAQSAAITGSVIKTAVDLFRSLPPEIQALAVAGLAINKLTGGLVTNIAGGLISAVISSFRGLMNVNAATVIVNGAVGGVGGLGAGAGAAAGGGLLATVGAVAIPVTIAAVGAKAATDLTNAQFADSGRPSNFMAPGSGNLPFGIEASLNNIGEILRLTQAEPARIAEQVAASATDTNSYIRLADRHTVDATGETTSYLRLADRHISEAIDNNTSRTVAAFKPKTAGEARKDIDADRRARGIKDTGPSKSIDPRLRFLAGHATGVKDVAVGNALATGFERGVTPLFRKTTEIPRAIKALERDQHQLLKAGDTKNAGLIGGDIKRLKAELGRRQAATTAAIKAKADKTIVNLATNTYLNGRIIQANLGRFETVVSGSANGIKLGR